MFDNYQTLFFHIIRSIDLQIVYKSLDVQCPINHDSNKTKSHHVIGVLVL